MSDDVINAVLAQWGLDGAEELPDAICGGSPNRVNARWAVRKNGVVYVLESIPNSKAASRLRQASFLETLSKNGCSRINPWLPSTSGLYGIHFGGEFWQLRKFAIGELTLPDNYSDDSWRGATLAEFLLELREKSDDIIDESPFLLSNYIPKVMHAVSHKNAALHEDLLPIQRELAPFLESEAGFPMAFCHGDYHPQNIVWGENRLNAVIDWEFCGVKTAMYDLANLLGCIGMDCPENFSAGLVTALLRRLHDAGWGAPDSWRWLPECIAASRFAWMREWCFMDNRDLMVQELDYIWLLLDNRDLLCRKFGKN